MSFIDTHAHLDAEEFDSDREEVIARAGESGIEGMICPGITADSSEAVLRLADAHEGIFAAVGIQPNYCAEAAPEDWDRIVALADHRRVVAVGETGLDRHWDYAPPEVQQDYFDRHLRLAAECDLPVVIHCREAEIDLVPLLRTAAARGPINGVLHAFSGNRTMAEACLELGLHVSFAGAVTYKNEKFDSLRAAVRTIPDDRILIETDCPYLAPHPLRGKRNEPSHVVHTARVLADLRGQSLDEFAAQTTANARQLFRLG